MKAAPMQSDRRNPAAVPAQICDVDGSVRGFDDE